MTRQDLDVFASVQALAIVGATLADLVDDVFKDGKEDGNSIVLQLTAEKARRLHFFANQIACDSRHLERAMDEAAEAEAGR